MLVLDNVEVKYSGVVLILRGVSLKLPSGGFVALLGANGAGKSTTLKAISGLLVTEEGRVTDGLIEFEGARIDQKTAEQIVRLGIVQVMEGRRIFPHLSAEENLICGFPAQGRAASMRTKLQRVYGYFPALTKLRQRTSGYLSGGEQQMMVMGRALMADPKVLLLDEPSLGLAPYLMREIFDILGRISSEERVSILLVEQNAWAALGAASYGYVLENGRMVLEGSAEDLQTNEDVREFYLGLSAVGRKSYREVKHYRRRKRWLG